MNIGADIVKRFEKSPRGANLRRMSTNIEKFEIEIRTKRADWSVTDMINFLAYISTSDEKTGTLRTKKGRMLDKLQGSLRTVFTSVLRNLS